MKLFQCSDCGAYLESEKDKEWHWCKNCEGKMHSAPRQFTCRVCKKPFLSVAELLEHSHAKVQLCQS